MLVRMYVWADGHVGLGVKVGKEVANSIRGAILDAKMQVVPVRRGYWGRNIGLPHTVANKIHGKCGSVHIRMVPAPRGTGLVAAPVAKKILQYAGVTDCFTQTRGTTMVQQREQSVHSMHFRSLQVFGG